MATTIACSCIALGSLSKLLTESTGTAPRTFADTSIRHEFLYETLGTERQLQSTNAVTGDINALKTSVRPAPYMVQGQIAVQPSPKQLKTWLPRIFGGPITGTSVAVNNTLPSFDCLVYRENGFFQYTDAMVAQAVLRGKTTNGGEGVQFMELIVALVGKTEILSGLSWPDPEPALGYTVDYLPYTFWDAELSLDTVDVPFEEFTMVVNNFIDVRFFNSQTPQCIRGTSRSIQMDIKVPFTCDNLAESLDMNSTDRAGVFRLESGNCSTNFAFPALRNTFRTPTSPGRTMIPLKYDLMALAPADGTPNVTITHDDTP